MAQYTKLEKAKAILVLDAPFFASLLLKYPMVERKDIPTLAIDARGQIYYNAAFTETLTVPQLVWGLAHEVMHRVGQHAARLHGRNPKKWNIATDAWINDVLDQCKVGERIDGTVNIPGSHLKTSDQIYNELPDSPNGDGQGGGDGDPMGDDLQHGNGGDGSDPVTEEELRQMEAQAKVDVAQAAATAKMKGKLPAALERFADAVINVKTPWFEILERFMTNKVKHDQSWKRPNRRFISAGLYMPVLDSVGAMGELVVGIDTSGSISRDELNEFGGHLNRIIEQCHPERIHVVYCDSAVAHVDVYTSEELPITLTGHGGGGTDMREIVKWTEKHAPDAEALVILTDNYTPFPDYEAVPTIWASTTDVKAPDAAGETIHIADKG